MLCLFKDLEYKEILSATFNSTEKNYILILFCLHQKKNVSDDGNKLKKPSYPFLHTIIHTDTIRRIILTCGKILSQIKYKPKEKEFISKNNNIILSILTRRKSEVVG